MASVMRAFRSASMERGEGEAEVRRRGWIPKGAALEVRTGAARGSARVGGWAGWPYWVVGRAVKRGEGGRRLGRQGY